jgi:hypothetical protein
MANALVRVKELSDDVFCYGKKELSKPELKVCSAIQRMSAKNHNAAIEMIGSCACVVNQKFIPSRNIKVAKKVLS